jgi:hypothetical protein
MGACWRTAAHKCWFVSEVDSVSHFDPYIGTKTQKHSRRMIAPTSLNIEWGCPWWSMMWSFALYHCEVIKIHWFIINHFPYTQFEGTTYHSSLGRAQVVKISFVSSSCTEPSDVVHFRTGAQTTRLRRGWSAVGWTAQTHCSQRPKSYSWSWKNEKYTWVRLGYDGTIYHGGSMGKPSINPFAALKYCLQHAMVPNSFQPIGGVQTYGLLRIWWSWDGLQVNICSCKCVVFSCRYPQMVKLFKNIWWTLRWFIIFLPHKFLG